MPHIIMGPAGGPAPPTPNEVKLLAEIARLSTHLRMSKERRRYLETELRAARERHHAAERLASLAGDFWNQAHNTIGFLDENAELLAETDAALVKTQITLLIEDYDKLNEETL